MPMAVAQVKFEKNKLMKDGQTYKLKDYKEVFDIPEAENHFKKARTNSTVSQIFAASGGGFIGYGVSRLLLGDPPAQSPSYSNPVVQKKRDKSGYWGLVGIGVGLVGIGIPFALSAEKNAKKAIAFENGETLAFQPHFKLETAGNGFALSYNF